MTLQTLFPLLACLASLLAAGPAWSDDGHNHGDTPAAVAGPALPRFAAVSESFELIGVLNGKQLSLYLDHAADNRPVKDAELALELGGVPVALKALADGEFEATLADAPAAGVTAVTATVVAGEESDLLAGELDIHDDHAAEAAAASTPWQVLTAWLLGGLVLLALLLWALRRAAARRAPRLGVAA